jgi:hypothetical protein
LDLLGRNGRGGALNELREKEILEGLSLGIVLTADGRSVKYIEANGYLKNEPVDNRDYPQYGRQLQGIYNQSLKADIIHGRHFNTVAKKNLWKFIDAQLNNWARIEYSGNNSNWPQEMEELVWALRENPCKKDHAELGETVLVQR